MAKRTWLITGVAGFVGSAMAAHCLRQGNRVVGLDNFYAGSRENLKDLLEDKNFNFYECDIRSQDLETIFKQHDITHILHLAAIVSVPICEQEPELAKDVNINGLNNIFSTVQKFPVEKFIYASSSAVYGAAEHMPVTENTVLAPLSIYGKTKVQNEQDAEAFSNTSGIPCVGLRFFNLFGGNPAIKSSYAAVMPLWLDAIKNDQPVVIYGDGSATRDFCYIDNVAQAIDCVTEADLTGHHIFNIGTQQAVSLKQLFVLLCDICDKHPEADYKAWRETDILHSCADITHAEKLLNYKPSTDIRTGLEHWLS